MINIPLISVIVPVYNTEKYLPECLESLKKQTYTNLEIILVDDGSTDKSPGICDRYSKENPNFSVLHTNNQGSLQARKIGFKKAKGELVTFVDSDDYVDNDFIEFLFNLKTKYQCDISVCGIHRVYSKYLLCKKPFLCDIKDTFKVIFADNFFSGSLCNKLYPKKIFHNINLPKQDMFEDLFINTEIIPKIKNAVFSAKSKYHYRIIKGSVSHKSFNKDKFFYFEINDKVRLLALQNNWFDLYDELSALAVIASFRNMIHIVLSSNKSREMMKEMKDRFVRELKSYLKINNRFIGRMFLLVTFMFNIVISDIYNLLKGRN